MRRRGRRAAGPVTREGSELSAAGGDVPHTYQAVAAAPCACRGAGPGSGQTVPAWWATATSAQAAAPRGCSRHKT